MHFHIGTGPMYHSRIHCHLKWTYCLCRPVVNMDMGMGEASRILLEACDTYIK